MRGRLILIGFVTSTLFWVLSAFAQEKPEKQEQPSGKSTSLIRLPARRVCSICTPSSAGTASDRLDFRVFHETNRRTFPTFAPPSYAEKNEKLFDGFLGRVENVLRTKRLLRLEREDFKVDLSYERQYSHGILYHPSQHSPVPASHWRMGIRLKL